MFSQSRRNVILNESPFAATVRSLDGHCPGSIWYANGVAQERMDRWNRVIRRSAMSRYLEFIEDLTDRQENAPVLKDVGCRAAAGGGEKAANKLCPRKRITRESRTTGREIW